jgi:hypothetical protein
MGKLIIGIAAVICLDLGFVAYMATDRVSETAKVVVDAVHDVSPELIFPVTSPAEVFPVEDDVIVVQTASYRAPKRVVHRSRRVYDGIAANRFETFPTNFKNVIIYYKDYTQTTDRVLPGNAMAAKAKARSRRSTGTADKRQLIASHVNKPWDTLKAAGYKVP